VWDKIKEHGINPHPAYRLGYNRLSCQHCIFADPDQVASNQELDPNAVEKLAEMEDKLGHTISATPKGEGVSIRDWAKQGVSFVTDSPDELKKLAMSTEFTEPIHVGDDWEMPKGAMKKGQGAPANYARMGYTWADVDRYWRFDRMVRDLYRAQFNEGDHPRDQDGQFTSGAETARAMDVPATELNRDVHSLLKGTEGWVRPVELFRQYKGKAKLLDFIKEVKTAASEGEVETKGKGDKFQVRRIDTESSLISDTNRRLAGHKVEYNPRQMTLFRKPGRPEPYRRVKDRKGQGTFDWNEEDHPRGQPGNAGQFASKEGGGSAEAPEAPEERKPQAEDNWSGPVIQSPAFKQWFGDWENDPQNSSKVVDENGEPEQQHSMVVDENGQPKKAYHGTSHGGWDTFEPRFGQASAGGISDHLLYGPGFYFTEDRGIAEEYTQIAREPEYSLAMDEDAANAKLRDRVEAVAEASDDEMLIEEAGDVMRDIDSGRYGVHRMVGKSKSQHDYFASTFGIDVSDLFEEKDDSEVKELYLNIRKPFDADNDRIPASPAMRETLERYIRESEEQGHMSEANEWREKLREGYTYQEALGFKPTKEALNEYLKELGYDGITHIGGRHMGSRDHQVWIAFQPNQIKSTDNRGTFDPNDNRMNYRKVKDRRGQQAFDWDESAHPRDEDGKFATSDKPSDTKSASDTEIGGIKSSGSELGDEATMAISELSEEAVLSAVQTDGFNEAAVRSVQAHTKTVVGRMNAACRMKIANNLERIKYAPDLNELTRQYNFFNLANRRLGSIGGFYMFDEQWLFLNGAFDEYTEFGKGEAKDTAEGIQAHEFAHAIDGPKSVYSNMVEWKTAYLSEIWAAKSQDAPLTRYATTDASEGFAEFGRLLFSETEYLQAAGRETIRATFPKCYKFWLDMGLIDD